jgi:hypothetical protein
MIEVGNIEIFIFLYLLCGVYVTVIYIDIIRQRHITKDYILMMMPDHAIDFFTEHPNAWNAYICLALVILVFIWPYVLNEIIKMTE